MEFLPLIIIFLLLFSFSFFFSIAEKNERKNEFKKTVISFKKDYNDFISNMNKHLSGEFIVNNNFLKEELISILHKVDHELLISDITDNFNLAKLNSNKSEVTNLFLDWIRISTETKNIFTIKKSKDKIISKLISEYNSGSSKYSHIKSKYLDRSNSLEFIPDKSYYQKNYFNRIIWLIDECYKSLINLDYQKALTIKATYDRFLEDTKSLLKEPSRILQDIHDTNFKLTLIEEDLSAHNMVSKFYKLRKEIELDKNIDISPTSRIKFDELKEKRTKFLSETKWCGNDKIKEVALIDIKDDMTSLFSRIAIDKKNKEELRKSLSRKGKVDLVNVFDDAFNY
jgi:hypothetical protein